MGKGTDIKLVVFDLGRVLIRICDGWQHACRVAGVTVPAALGEVDPALAAEAEAVSALYDTGAIDTETFARRLAPHRGLRPEDVVRLINCYLLGPYPGVTDLVDELTRSGVRTACLSNTSDAHWRMMLDPVSPNYLPLEKLTHRFASHLVGLRKPDAAIYARVERETGVAPGGIVFFDDVEENVEAARRRGWQAHRIDPAPDDPVPQARSHLRAHGVL